MTNFSGLFARNPLQFGLTYQFPVNIKQDFTASKPKKQASKLRDEPLMLKLRESDLYERVEEELFDLDLFMGEETEAEPTYNVSAFLNDNDQIVLTTPEVENVDPAIEAKLVKKMLEEAGVVQERVSEFVRGVLNGGKQFTPELEKSGAQMLQEIDAERNSVVLPKGLVDSSLYSKTGWDLYDALKNKVFNAIDNEDYIIEILNHCEGLSSFNSDHWFLSPAGIIGIAAENGQTKVLDYLEAKGYLLVHPRNAMSSVACKALQAGQTHVIDHLIEKGHSIGDYGMEPGNLLYNAVASGSIKTVKYLEKRGVALTALTQTQNEPKTAVQSAVVHNKPEVLDYLLKNNVPLKATEDDDGSALMLAAASSGHWEMMEKLNELGISYYVEDKEGNTIFHKAVKSGHLHILKEFKNFEVLARNNNQELVFHVAIPSRIKELMEIYKDSGFMQTYFMDKDSNGNTPAHLMVEHLFKRHSYNQDDMRDCLKLFYERGVDFDKENNEGQTVWDMVPDVRRKKKRITVLKQEIGVQ